MVANTKKAEGHEEVEEVVGKNGFQLLDLSFGRSVEVEGKFKLSKIEKNKKGMAMIRLEGEKHTVLISIGGKTNTNLWAAVVETTKVSTGPTLVKL